jgi:hypothetical protein
MIADFVVFDAQGVVLASMEDAEFSSTTAAAFLGKRIGDITEFELNWNPVNPVSSRQIDLTLFSPGQSFSRKEFPLNWALPIEVQPVVFDSALAELCSLYAVEALKVCQGQVLSRTGQKISNRFRKLAETFQPKKTVSEILAHVSEQWRPELNLVQACGPHLGMILLGKSDPLELIFPKGDDSLARAIYRDSLNGNLMNWLAGQVVGQFAAKRGFLRILEIGAGTGGTTSFVLPVLSRRNEKFTYHFTDLSSQLLKTSQKRFESFDGL